MHPPIEKKIPGQTALEKLFPKPLILGASVSADWLAPSPGKKLALRYTPASQIRTLAQGGTSGQSLLKKLQDADLKDRSIIIGIDLFFWDSSLNSDQATLAAIENLISRAEQQGIPLILGEVPELIPHRQPHLKSINEALHAAATKHAGLKIMRFGPLLQEIFENEYLLIKGRKVPLSELVPDGLHISDIASEYLADQILAACSLLYQE